MSELVVLLPPFAGESGLGYLRRLAQENRIGTWRHLVDLAGVRPTRDVLQHSGSVLAKALGLAPGWIKQVLGPGSAGAAALYDRRFQKFGADAVCPRCLKESAYVRQAWPHLLVTACPTHRVGLVDRCPACARAFGWDRPDLLACECGQDLTSIPSEAASTAELWLSSRLAGENVAIKSMPLLERDEERALLADLVMLLCADADSAMNRLRPRLVREASLDVVRQFLAPLGAMLGAWPESFADHVQRRLETGPQDAATLPRRLGPWYRGLMKLCANGSFSEFWQVFTDVVTQRFDGATHNHRYLQIAQRDRTFIPVTVAAKLLKMRRETLAQAVSDGLVHATVKEAGPNYTQAFIPRGELDRVLEARELWIPSTEAREALGVGKTVLEKLVEVGAVTFDSGWQRDPLKRGPIERRSIRALIGALSAALKPQESPGAIALRDLTGTRIGDGRALTALYQAIVSGDLVPVGRLKDDRVGGLLYARDDVATYANSASLSASITIENLSSITGWKYEAIAHWAEIGLLQAEEVQYRGRTTRIIPVPALVAFMRKYIPISDLAQHLSTNRSTLIGGLQAMGVTVRGFTPIPEGTQRGGVVAYRELVRRRISGIPVSAYRYEVFKEARAEARTARRESKRKS